MSPKRQNALAQEATNTRERHRLELKAKYDSELQNLENEMEKEIQDGTLLNTIQNL